MAGLLPLVLREAKVLLVTGVLPADGVLAEAGVLPELPVLPVTGVLAVTGAEMEKWCSRCWCLALIGSLEPLVILKKLVNSPATAVPFCPVWSLTSL